MTRQDIDDETLMAYADGELDDATAQRVSKAAASDATIAARIQMFRNSRKTLRGAAQERTLAPLPDALQARVMAVLAGAQTGVQTGVQTGAGFAPAAANVAASAAANVAASAAANVAASTDANVVPLRSRDATGRGRWQMALAASVALTAGALGGILATRGTDDEGGLRMSALDRPGLAAALASVASGERRAIEGGATVVSVACHSGQAWDIRFAVAAPGADADGYAPASSLETIDAYLVAIGAGAPMTREAEAQALADLGAGGRR